MTSDTATGSRYEHELGEQPSGASVPGAGPTSWQLRLRRYGYAEQPRTPLRDRLVPPYRTAGTRVWTLLGVDPYTAEKLVRWAAWAGPLLVALLAGALRFWHLGSPDAVIFDETYYAKDAWSLLQLGYEGSWPDKANEKILRDPQSIPLNPEHSYVVHPPVGKWTIALGEGLFGLHPLGWRFMPAVLGTLSVLMVCRIGRRLFRSTALGCLAGALLAVDGLHFVMSRTALLDLVVMFWVLAAFGALLIDRDKARAKLADALTTAADRGDAPAPTAKTAGETDGTAKGTKGTAEETDLVRPDALIGDRLGLGLRPWRLAAGLFLGLACATKWNGLYILAAFGLLTVLWDAAARRTAGAHRPYRSMLRRDAVPAFLSIVPVAVVTYTVSWAGWFLTRGGYFRGWAEGRRGLSPDSVSLFGLRVPLPQVDMTWVPEPLRSLWHYQSEVYNFHVGLTDPHPYQSNPWSWLVLGRPVSYFYESPQPGEDGCPVGTADKCAREVLALGTPMLWWAACFAVLYLVYRWGFRRDWRAGAILCGIAGGWLPWFLYQERTIFFFYAVVFVPFLCLAVAMAIGALLGPPGSSEQRRVLGTVGAGVLVLLIVWNFIYFFPLHTGQPIPVSDWQDRMWLDTWV
ncbi:phospholipid carrier-dependent glycosyltransferase [Streptomyces sp. WAC 00631]|uniref:dolichyl-phosphate-mannose--protein mannosyltransferase n=1 Tax=Streptomyces sp. WAC 00631 TaxID=2203201 RepID=UPI000F784CD1|nr:phospholipid carrier-dependent glycosyltransferase [Streptomyces sp. WAC 00631]MCC5032973.1 phospholipid carrier-dependent glycosyltransferase [Streptomyces sp. WAC 00631]